MRRVAVTKRKVEAKSFSFNCIAQVRIEAPFFVKCSKIKMSMKFKVYYSIEKDIWNHLNANWRFSYTRYGREHIQEKILKPFPEEYKTNLAKAKTKEEAVKVIKHHLDTRAESFKRILSIIVKGVEQILNEEKDNIIGKLEKTYNKPFPFNEITVYLTTAYINPYNYEEKWFMSSCVHDIDGHIRTATHELNHFMFYYYYPHLKDKLGEEKFEILKEALAIYTNPEGNERPTTKKMERYFMEHLNKTIEEVIEKGKWEKYF